MSIAVVLKVFKNSSLVTEQGEFKISRIFNSRKAANKAGYIHHITSNGIEIYTRGCHRRVARFAVIDS